MKNYLIVIVTGIAILGLYYLSQPDATPIGTTAPAASQPGYAVRETVNGGDYLYIRYSNDNADSWIATRGVEVEVGDRITHAEGMEMRDFHSRALNRTFESLWFVDQLEVLNRPTPEKIIAAAHSAQQQSATDGAVETPKPGEIAPLEGGSTIANILTGYPDHAGQAASLRARVTKVSDNIMGRTWVTLQDGSGNAPDLQLIATTSEMVEPGDIVVVEGVIANDISLGYGYDYKVLLEEAHFITET